MVLNRPSPRTDTSRHAVTPASPPAGVPGVLPGDILYAVNRVTLDSDAPGPAMVEVIMGPFRGARAIGSFQRLGEHLVLRFSSFVLRDGSRYAVQAYAIDPATDRTAVSGSVDRHFLARWGGLVAASFLEGFGDAVARSGVSSTSTIYGSSAPAWADAQRAFWSRMSGCRPRSSSNQAPKWGCCSLRFGNDPAQGRDGAGLRRK